MAKLGPVVQKRCVECRARFEPHPCAGRGQMTCSAECRRSRNARLARGRRRRSPDRFLRSERKRQQRRRARLKATAGPEMGPISEPVSRAGLELEVSEVLRLMGESWEKSLAMSRARLKRQVRKLSGLRGGKVGRDLASNAECHAPG